MSTRRLAVILALFAPAAFGGEASPAPLAAKYPADIGIHTDPNVIFHDDFEAWTGGDFDTPPSGKWTSKRSNQCSRTVTIPGQAVLGGPGGPPGPGARVLQIACWNPGGGSQSGGLSLKLGNYEPRDKGLGPGYDELFVRCYIRFAGNYKGVQNHGSNLGGRDVAMTNSRWVGMADTRDVAAQGYFYSGLQPYGGMGRQTGICFGFYSYHMDKPGRWGDDYAMKSKPVEVGRWYCLERHMKLNAAEPLQADGIEELWLDGQLIIRKEGLRFRRVPHLKINFFSFETYYHGLPEEFNKDNPIRVQFDNLVLAKQYIGPVVMRTTAGNKDKPERETLQRPVGNQPEGPTAEQQKRAAEVARELRAKIIQEVKAGRSATIYVTAMETRLRAAVTDADDEALTVDAAGISVRLEWDKMTPPEFYDLARRLVDDHDALFEFCVGRGLKDEAEEERSRR